MPQNLFKIFDGRNCFWQWDTNQKLIVLDATIDEVHFSNRDMNHAIPKDVYTDKDGKRICNIPDELLTLPKNLVASAYVTDDNANKTLRSIKFAVRQRPIPADYIVSENFQLKDFDERLDVIEESIDDSCFIQKFNIIEDAELWAQEFKNAGTIISVNTGSAWELYIVEDDYSITSVGSGGDKEGLAELQNLIGQLPSTSNAKTIVEYINAKTESVASDEAIRELSARIEDVATNTLTLKVALTDEGENVVADKSFAEIFNAYNDGRTVCVVYRNGIYPLTLIRNEGAVFGLDDGVTHERIMCRSYGDIDTWTYTIEEAIASSYYLGGVRAEPRTDDYTVPVKIGNNGFLYIPEAQEQAQSDWNANNETSTTYIKNRPFYDSREDIELFNGQATSIYSATLPERTYNVDNKYVVVFDGVEYELSFQKTTKPTQLASGEYYYLGSPAYFNGTPYVTNDEEYPFCITTFSDSLENVKLMIVTKAQQHFPVNVQVIEKSGELKQIDAKYLPNGAVVQSDWSVMDEASEAYIKNKPFGDIVSTVDISGVTYTIGKFTSDTFTVSHDAIPLEIGQVWSVQGTNDSSGKTVSVQINDDGELYLGTPTVNNFPFYIRTTETTLNSSYWYQMQPSYLTLTCVSGAVTTMSVKQLSQKYVPNADWNINDENADGYVKNRTHYAVDRELLASFKMSVANVNSYSVDDALSSDVIRSYINNGNNTVDVFIDGVLYQCQAIFTKGHYYINLDGSTNTEQGLRIYIGGNKPNMIYLHPESFGLDMSADTRMVEVYTHEVLKQLDPKYIKDMYYEEFAELFSVENAEFVDRQYMCETPFAIEVGNTYVINWDGIEYVCDAYMFDGTPAIGNTSLFGGKGNGEPFCIGYMHLEDITFVYGFDDLITHTFSVSGAVYHTIAHKYIKDMYYETSELRDIVLIDNVILDEFEDSESGFYNQYTNYYIDFVGTEGQTYFVIWDGTEYECVCKGIVEDFGVGNENVLGSYGSTTNEPFAIHHSSSEDAICVSVKDNGIHTLSIIQRGMSTVVHQIDAKYLPILEEISEVILEADDVSDESVFEGPTYKKLLGRYVVIVDGVSEVIEFIDGLDCSWCEANRIYIETWDATPDWYGGFYIGFPDENDVHHTVKLIRIKQIIKEEYLPDTSTEQSDWNQNDSTASDYIKNRTHWDESFILDVSDSDEAYDFDSDFGFLRVSTNPDDFPNDIEGLIVEYNDVVYSNVTHNNWPAHNAAVYSIEVDDVEYDVAVVVRQENTDITVYKGGTRYRITNPGIGVWVIYDPGVSSRATAKIYTNNVHPLDEKYIPNTIARISQIDSKMNKSNPIGTGSLSMNRKSGSSEGISSTTLGYNGSASGQYALAEGAVTSASGYASHAEGYNTNATRHAQHVEGQFNILDTEGTTKGKYVHIVGNGTALDKRSNAHTLDWSGNAWFKGAVKVGGTGQDDTAAKELATQEYVNSAIAAIPTPDVSGQIDAHNTSETAHNDIRAAINNHGHSWNDLSDKPFGQSITLGRIIAEEQVVEVDVDGSMVQTIEAKPFKENGMYLIKINGNEYIAHSKYVDAAAAYCCGNAFFAYPDFVEDTGESFFVENDYMGNFKRVYLYTSLADTEVTVSITEVDGYSTQTLDEVYIPDTIARKPKLATITMSAANWTGDKNPWSQVVAINGVTANSKIDLQPTAVQIVELQDADIMLMVENNNGTATAYALGDKPTKDYTMQALITEVTPV